MNKIADIVRSDILGRSVSIDLEVDPDKARIFAYREGTISSQRSIILSDAE